jgi:hypothetical protein
MRPGLLLIVILGLMIGCKSKLEQPENVDPIYTDLLGEIAKAKSDLASKEKILKKAKEDWEAVEPQTGHEQIKRADYFKKLKRVEKAEQELKYQTIRAESRKKWVRKQYEAAYANGESWPPEGEYEKYFTNKRLKEASRNWNQRVPKLKDRVDSYIERQLAAEEEAEKAKKK